MPIKFSLVDNDEHLLQTLKLGIESLGEFICVGCHVDAEEALAGITRDPVDVVLMGSQIPGVSGIEYLQRLKTGRPNLAVIMLTDTVDDDTIHQAMQSGAAGYLVKPVRPGVCAAAMRATMRGGKPWCRTSFVSPTHA